MLCTLADIKSRLSLTNPDADRDAMLTTIIRSVTSIFESFCSRKFIVPATPVTEYYTGAGPWLQVLYYPIVTIISVKEALDYDYTMAPALVADTDYRLVNAGRKGCLYRCWGDWPACPPDSIEVVYRGGYTAADQTPGIGETAIPADLKEAAILQTCLLYKRRDDLGLSGGSFPGGSYAKFADIDLLPVVKDILNNGYRRIML
ncbi:hypothetical protein ACQ9LF_06285 [Anaerohalosphaeraceae bacterium U12dextr]|jgi:hypothetical protein